MPSAKTAKIEIKKVEIKKVARPKTAAERQARVKTILSTLDQMYPDASCALVHSNAWELLAATILSAQCTDKRVNMVTPSLFRKYPTIQDFARAHQAELAQDVRTTGFFNNKAKSLIGAARKIVADFQGEVPRNIDDLLTVPGAARKTANVVLGSAFGIASGIVVDTHVTTGFAASGSDQTDRSRENRAGSGEADSQGEVDFILAPDHSARTRFMRREKSQVRRMQTRSSLLRAGQDQLESLAGGVLAVQMQPLVDRVQRQFQTVGNAQLVEDVVQMVLHRLLADEHLLGHFFVLVALRHQRDDFALARR